MDTRRTERGLTWVSFLLLVIVAAAGYWAWVFGPVYLDNSQVKQVCATAANMAYTEHNDQTLHNWIYDHIREKFAYQYMQPNGTSATAYKVELDPRDVILERTETPAAIHIAVSYSRTVALPIVGGERTLVFNVRSDQDLSPVKW